MGKRKLSKDQPKSRKGKVSSSSACTLPDETAKKKGIKTPPKGPTSKSSEWRTARDMTAAGNAGTTGTRTPQQQTAMKDQSKSRNEKIASALAAQRVTNTVHKTKQNVKITVHKAKQNVKQKHPKTQKPKSTCGTSGPRTLQQESTILRALGLTERPKYPVAEEMYQMEFSEFRQHFSNKLPLYDGRAVVTLGSSRKSRNYKLVCALHPACPFLLHSKQQVYADGLVCQEIKEVVNHTCSAQSHADISLCSSTFLAYFLREGQHLFQTKDAYVQAGEKFGIDFTSMPRRQMFYKAARNKQDDDSALSAFRSPSPICVTQIPTVDFDACAQRIVGIPQLTQSKRKSDQSMRDEVHHSSSLECESDSTTAKLAITSAESTSSSVTLVHTTSVVANPKSKQSKRKSDQSIRREEANHSSSFKSESDSTNPKPKQSKRKSNKSMRREANQPSSLECESDSTTAKLATASAESTSSRVPLVGTTGVVENPKPKQSKRKSVPSKESKRKFDQSIRREAKRKPEHESVMDNNVARKDNNIARKKRKVLNGRSTPATNALPNSDPTPQPTSTPNSSQRSARKSKPEYLKLLESYTPLVDELSARTSRPPCRTGSTSTMNQHSVTKTNADRIQKSNILAKRTPPPPPPPLPVPSRSLKPDCEESADGLKPDCEESADDSLLSPALSFPLRKTRASTSKTRNSSEKQQPDNLNQESKSDLKQQSNRKLKPARVRLRDGLTPGMEYLPPRRSAVFSAATFNDTKRQPTRKGKPEHERLLDDMTPTVDDLPPRRSGVVSIDTIAAKQQPESKQDDQSSSIATRQSTRKVKSENERLVECMTPVVDGLPPRRSVFSYTATCTDTDTVAAKQQPDRKRDQQSRSIATRQSTRLVDGTTPAMDDLPPRRLTVSYTAAYTKTDADTAGSTIVSSNTIEGKQHPSSTAMTQPVVGDVPSRRTRASCTGATSVTLSEPSTKLKLGHEKPVVNSTSVIGDLPSRRTRASNTVATSVTLSELDTKHKKPAENSTSVVEDLPSRRTRASCTGATSDTLSESGIELKLGHETSVVGDLPSRRTRASYTGATSVTLSEPGTKLKLEHEKPMENSTSVVEDFPSRGTRASYTGASSVPLSKSGHKQKTDYEQPENSTSVVGDLPSWRTRDTGATSDTLSEPGIKLKLEHEKPVENSTSVVGDLPSRRTRASYRHTGATSDTLPEPVAKLKLEHEKPVESSTSVAGNLSSRRTRASYTGATSVTLAEPGSKPDHQCRKLSMKPEHERLLQNAMFSSDELVPKRSSATRSGAITSKQFSGSNLKQQPSRKQEQERGQLLDNLTPPIHGLRPRRACASIPGANTELYSTKEQPESKRSQNYEQSGGEVNHVSVHTPEHGRLLVNMAPVFDDPPPRKTRSSFHSEIGSATQQPRGRLDKQRSRHLRSEIGESSLGNLPAQGLISEPNADSRQSNRQLEKRSSRKLRSEHSSLKDNSTPVLGDLPPRKTRASSTEFVSTTHHLPIMMSQQAQHANTVVKQLPARKAEGEKQFEGLTSFGDFRPRGSRGHFEAGQPPNHKRKTEHKVLLGDCPEKKPRTIVSHPKLKGGTSVSRDSGPLWINPGELREVDVVVAETSAQISGPVVLFHVALVEEYRRLASRDVYEFVNFGLSLASTKAAIDLKLKELNLNMDKDHGDKDIEAERVDHSRSLKDFSRLADAERLEKIRESEEDARQRLVADYHNRTKRVNPMRAEVSTLISRPIRFEEGMEVGRRIKEPCCIGSDCTFCQKANAQDIQPREEPLPRFRQFDMTQLDSIDESNDDAGTSVARARRNRPTRDGKRAASRLALSEMQHSLAFIEELNSTERTISHRLF